MSYFMSPLSTESSSVLNGDTKQDTFGEQILSNMLAPYIVQEEPSHFAEELFANYVDDENDNPPLCDLNSFNISVEQEELLKSLDKLDIIDIIEDEGLKYVAGYAAYRFKHKYPYLDTKTCFLPVNVASLNDLDWLQFISRGNCIYPSKELLETARVMNTEFVKFHGSSLCKDKFIFNTLATKIKNIIHPIEIPKEVILCLVRTRTYIRVREINRTISMQNRNNSNKKKKLSKFINNKIR